MMTFYLGRLALLIGTTGTVIYGLCVGDLTISALGAAPLIWWYLTDRAATKAYMTEWRAEHERVDRDIRERRERWHY